VNPITTHDEMAEHSRMLESDLDSLFKLVFTYRKPLAEGDIRSGVQVASNKFWVSERQWAVIEL